MTGAEATLLAGVVGAGSAVLSAALASLGTYKVTQRSINAQTQRDREQRVAEAYTDLLWLVSTTMGVVELTRPVVSRGEQFPEPIPLAEELRIRARAEIMGSREMRTALRNWHKTLAKFVNAVGTLDELSGGPGQPRPAHVPVEMWQPPWRDLLAAREALGSQTAELERIMQAELTGRADPGHEDDQLA